MRNSLQRAERQSEAYRDALQVERARRSNRTSVASSRSTRLQVENDLLHTELAEMRRIIGASNPVPVQGGRPPLAALPEPARNIPVMDSPSPVSQTSTRHGAGPIRDPPVLSHCLPQFGSPAQFDITSQPGAVEEDDDDVGGSPGQAVPSAPVCTGSCSPVDAVPSAPGGDPRLRHAHSLPLRGGASPYGA